MTNSSSATTTENLVDKLIGKPYEFVKFVANNISLVQLVGRALAGVNGTEPMLTKRSLSVTGAMGAIGATVTFALPVGTDTTKIRAISVRMTGSTGAKYFNDSRYMNVFITSAGLLSVELKTGSLAELANCAMSALLTLDS